MPGLRRFKVVMLAAPLSMSIAAGVSARISEIRQPVRLKTRQKSCTSKGAWRAALMKRRRSAQTRPVGRKWISFCKHFKVSLSELDHRFHETGLMHGIHLASEAL